MPLRLLGGLHYLVLGGEAVWDGVTDALDAHRGFLRRFVREQGVQTNEVQRSWILLPGFLEAARRTGSEVLDLVELGPSAGLNLVWDRYRFRYAAGEWGRSDGRLLLTGEERRAVPGDLLARRPTVRGRVGIDRAPVDVTTENGARLLKAFVWADQRERLERLDRAIAALREHPPDLLHGDFVELLPEVLADRPSDGIAVVFQTAALAYVGEEGRDRLRAALDDAGRSAPLAFLTAGRPRAEGSSAFGLRLIVWPDEPRYLADTDVHGAWIEWAG